MLTQPRCATQAPVRSASCAAQAPVLSFVDDEYDGGVQQALAQAVS